MENEKLFLPEDVISYFNEFPETIIDNRILYMIIYLIFFTLVDYNKLVEYLKENNNLKNKKILNEMKNIKEERNKNNLDNFEGINDDFTIENYKKINKVLYDKTKDKNYFSDLLEFCLINALMLVFNCGKDHTINIYLYDNFNKIKRGKFFENLEKNSFVTEVLKQPFESYLKETVEYNFNEETLEFTNDKKEIIKKKQYLSLITNLGKSLNDKLIGFFYNFEERVDELLKKVEKENSTSSKISPLIYMGMIIKFKKFQLIYEKGNEELKKYICSQIKILYSYPKSSFNYLFYILFTIFKIKNSSQIKKTKTTFKFEISQAFLEYDSSFVMASIIKYDKRIKHIIFNQNKFGEIGFYELGKNLLFNQNIIILNIGQMNITTSHLNFFNIGLNGYCSAIELNYNNNIKINSTSGKAIAESITKFPNLIRLNLNKCELGTGTKYVLKTILENPMKIKHLFLSKTLMDETSIKILNKIIEKKNCTIQILSVSNCNFNNKYGRKFLRSMCKNISIEELYMYNCELDDSYYCDVRNLIISGNLNVLSLYKNKFSNFESILKLIHLTSTQKKGYKTGSQLINLDLSVNPIKKNSICNKYIDIFVNVCYNTTLKILDISQTLNGENPKIKNEEDENKMDIDESTKSKSSIENSELNESKRIENLNERLKDIENKDIYF